MAQGYGDRLTVLRVNIHDKDTAHLQEQFGFMATPEFHLLDAAGNIVGFWDDSVKVGELKQAIDQALGAP